MDSQTLRKKFLEFFTKHGHTIVPSSSLLPTDPSVLFTTAGMQQFKEYFLGKKSPYGNKVTSCQKCFRTSDIEGVGDDTHLTFLEMLGNFSFGGYFKEEAIKFAYEFLINNLQLPISQLTVTVFGGDPSTSSGQAVPRDKEAEKIWSGFGFSEEKGNLRFAGRADNFWGPTGKEGPCGPTAEIYLRGIEVWNLVFNEYYQDETGKLTPLKQKGVDTGMGLERLAMISQGKPSVFETDLFSPLLEEIEKISAEPYRQNPRPYRIIADHIKGAIFLIAAGIMPSNVERGYVLRRILRRTMRFGRLFNFPRNFLIPLAQKAMAIYQDVYPEVGSGAADILTVIQKEEERFGKTLAKGLKQFDKIAALGDIAGIDAFHLFDTYGFPLELTQELAKEKKLKVDQSGFEEAFRKHKDVSKAGAEKKFGGGGGYSPKLHTATHLLHAALREVLGNEVKQMGSDINPARLRFDFSHAQKMTGSQIKKVEEIVNQKIKEDLEVKKSEVSYEEAVKSGASAFFKEKYPERVTVYSVANPSNSSLREPEGSSEPRTAGQVFSREICVGPHVKKTGELGHFKIIKEESSGAGVRRIRAVLE